MTKRNRSRSGSHVECPLCGRKLRGEKGLKMHVAAEHDQHGGLTEFELTVLRAFQSDKIEELVAGAALGQAFEVLSGSGYLTMSGKITEKGMAVLS